MIKRFLIVLGLIAAATAIPLNEPVPDIVSDALLFNASLGAWNPAAAVSYAKANCGSGPGLCAEFASRAIAAGGAGNPVITWVPTLQSVRLPSSLRIPMVCRSRLRTVVSEQRLEKHRIDLLWSSWLHRHL
jgi:hypothetical protein